MDKCPKCQSSWLSVAGYRPEIQICGGYIGVYDCIVAIKCPDCRTEFPGDDSKWGLDLFKKYKEKVDIKD